MKGDYFHHVVNSCLALRKLQSIYVENPDGVHYSMRPQMHLFVCQPFGTGKSSVFKQIKKALKGDCLIEDDFTRAGFYGSMMKNSVYVEGLVNELGGKVLCIDEWNSVVYDGRAALLSVLENNYFSRKLGFKRKGKPIHVEDEWTDITVHNSGKISGSVYFTCIAGAMFFPRNPNLQQGEQIEEALLSRFTPYFRTFSVPDVLEMCAGKLYTGFEDYAPSKVRNVIIAADCVKEIKGEYDTYVGEKKMDFTHRQVGYVPRVWTDFIRFGVANAFRHKKGNSGKYVIGKAKYFLDNLDVVLGNQFRMYESKDLKTTEEMFLELAAKEPNEPAQYYADRLGVTTRTIRRYSKKNNIDWIGEKDE